MPGKVKGLYWWCKKVTDGYDGVQVKNMTSSWKNGLALCALINRFRPDLIDFYSLSPEDIYYNNDLAFRVAEKEFGIPQMLDAQDMVTMATPDRFSMATYLSAFYDFFKNQPMHDPPEKPNNAPSPVNTLTSVSDNLNVVHKIKLDFKDWNEIMKNYSKHKSFPSRVSNREYIETSDKNNSLGENMPLKTKCDLTTFEDVSFKDSREIKPCETVVIIPAAAINVEILESTDSLTGDTILDECDSGVSGQNGFPTGKCSDNEGDVAIVFDVAEEIYKHNKTKHVRLDENSVSSIHETDTTAHFEEQNYPKQEKSINCNGTEPDEGDERVLADVTGEQVFHVQLEQTLNIHSYCIDKTDSFVKQNTEVYIPPHNEYEEKKSDSSFNVSTETVISEVINNNDKNLFPETVESLNNELILVSTQLLSEFIGASEKSSDTTDTNIKRNTTERLSDIPNENCFSNVSATEMVAATLDNVFEYISFYPELLKETEDNILSIVNEMKGEPNPKLDDDLCKDGIKQHNQVCQNMTEAIKTVPIENSPCTTCESLTNNECDLPSIEMLFPNASVTVYATNSSVIDNFGNALQLDGSEDVQDRDASEYNDIDSLLLHLDESYSVTIPCENNDDLPRNDFIILSTDVSSSELDCEPPPLPLVGPPPLPSVGPPPLPSVGPPPLPSVSPPNLLKNDTVICVFKTPSFSRCSENKSTKDETLFNLEHSSNEDTLSSVYQKYQEMDATEIKFDTAFVNTGNNNTFQGTSKNICLKPEANIYFGNANEHLSSSQNYDAEESVIKPHNALLCENIKVGDNSYKTTPIIPQIKSQLQSETQLQVEAQLQYEVRSPWKVSVEHSNTYVVDTTKLMDIQVNQDTSTSLENSINHEESIEMNEMQFGEVELDSSLKWVDKILTKQTQSGEGTLESIATGANFAEQSSVKNMICSKNTVNYDYKKPAAVTENGMQSAVIDADNEESADEDLTLLNKAAKTSKIITETLATKMSATKTDMNDNHTAASKIISNYIAKQMQSGRAPSAELNEKEMKAHRMSLLQHNQYYTEPTKKTNFYESVSSNSNFEKTQIEFQNKMKIWDKRSSLNVEPCATELCANKRQSVPKQRISLTLPLKVPLSSPAVNNPNHLKKLNENLLAIPAPGSIADYVRKLSQRSLTQRRCQSVIYTDSDNERSKIRNSWGGVHSLNGQQFKQQIDSGLSNTLQADEHIQEECIKLESTNNAECVSHTSIIYNSRSCQQEKTSI